MHDDQQTHLLKTAGQFDVHRWSDYPEVKAAVDSIFKEIADLRRSKGIRLREPDKISRHLRVVVIDLIAAAKLGFNPYRGISLRKNDYQKGTRYRRIHLKYDYLAGVLSDLVELGYVDKHSGYFLENGKGRRTRINATPMLLDRVFAREFGVENLIEAVGYANAFQRSRDDECIRLHGPDGKLLDYTDTAQTTVMRERLQYINTKIASARIALDIPDAQVMELQKVFDHDNAGRRIPIDFGRVELYRVFNNTAFNLGGRFYGGWWQALPSRFRKYITINHRDTVELDYSGHHIRMLYSKEGLQAPEDLYAVENCPFSRQALKLATLVVVNASNRTSALKAINRKKLGVKAEELVGFLEGHFSGVSKYFYSEVGLKLQYEDSVVAERVMLKMIERGAVVLPIHDSFIVRSSYEDELWTVMVEEYRRDFGQATFLKRDKTVYDEAQKAASEESDEFPFVTDDLEELFEETKASRTWSTKMFGN